MSKFANELEDIFDKLDKLLHKETYLNLQDKVFSLEDDLEKANETIEEYEDNC